MEQNVGRIGQSVVIKGELTGSEDLIIEGQVEGKVELDHNVLTIGSTGRITAQVLAKVVIVMGKVNGNITATEAINIRETASVDGALVAPRVGIAEGASFRGQIDMRRSQDQNVPVAGTGKGTQVLQQPVEQRVTSPDVPISVATRDATESSPTDPVNPETNVRAPAVAQATPDSRRRPSTGVTQSSQAPR